MAGQCEMLKQDLATCYDFNLDACYKVIDDCNFGFIDTSNLKRFLVKCCIYASDALLISIIRRMDLDADARLNKREFFDGIQPLENFTKGSLTEMKKATKKSNGRQAATATGHRKMSAQKMGRPQTAHVRQKSPTPYGQMGTYINPNANHASAHERDFVVRSNGY